jgi:hypothetical protein
MIRLSRDSTAPRRLLRKNEDRRRREASAHDPSIAGAVTPQARPFYSVLH